MTENRKQVKAIGAAAEEMLTVLVNRWFDEVPWIVVHTISYAIAGVAGEENCWWHSVLIVYTEGR